MAAGAVRGEMQLLLANENISNKCHFCLLTRIFLILIYVAAEKPIWEMSVEISLAVPSGIEKIKSALGHRKK